MKNKITQLTVLPTNEIDLEDELFRLDTEIENAKNKVVQLTKAREDFMEEHNLGESPKSTLIKAGVIIALAISSLIFASIPALVNAQDIHKERPFAGVDFSLIDWCELCASVEPVAYGGCDVVHPANAIVLSKPSGFAALEEKFNAKPTVDCKATKRNYELWKTNKSHCKSAFKKQFNLLITGEVLRTTSPLWTPEQFRDKYLSAGIIDVEGINKMREIYRSAQ